MSSFQPATPATPWNLVAIVTGLIFTTLGLLFWTYLFVRAWLSTPTHVSRKKSRGRSKHSRGRSRSRREPSPEPSYSEDSDSY